MAYREKLVQFQHRKLCKEETGVWLEKTDNIDRNKFNQKQKKTEFSRELTLTVPIPDEDKKLS